MTPPGLAQVTGPQLFGETAGSPVAPVARAMGTVMAPDVLFSKLMSGDARTPELPLPLPSRAPALLKASVSLPLLAALPTPPDAPLDLPLSDPSPVPKDAELPTLMAAPDAVVLQPNHIAVPLDADSAAVTKAELPMPDVAAEHHFADLAVVDGNPTLAPKSGADDSMAEMPSRAAQLVPAVPEMGPQPARPDGSSPDDPMAPAPGRNPTIKRHAAVILPGVVSAKATQGATIDVPGPTNSSAPNIPPAQPPGSATEPGIARAQAVTSAGPGLARGLPTGDTATTATDQPPFPRLPSRPGESPSAEPGTSAKVPTERVLAQVQPGPQERPQDAALPLMPVTASGTHAQADIMPAKSLVANAVVSSPAVPQPVPVAQPTVADISHVGQPAVVENLRGPVGDEPAASDTVRARPTITPSPRAAAVPLPSRASPDASAVAGHVAVGTTDVAVTDAPGSDVLSEFSIADMQTSGSSSEPHQAQRQVPPAPPRFMAPIADMARIMQPDKPVEIELNPAELGRVRMVLTETDGSMILSISVERPETMDMMRRHIDGLLQDLKQAGYSSLSLDVQTGGGAASGNGRNAPDRGTAILADTAPSSTAAPASPGRNIRTGGRLDIRL